MEKFLNLINHLAVTLMNVILLGLLFTVTIMTFYFPEKLGDIVGAFLKEVHKYT